jgi:hypothetical protein
LQDDGRATKDINIRKREFSQDLAFGDGVDQNPQDDPHQRRHKGNRQGDGNPLRQEGNKLPDSAKINDVHMFSHKKSRPIKGRLLNNRGTTFVPAYADT